MSRKEIECHFDHFSIFNFHPLSTIGERQNSGTTANVRPRKFKQRLEINYEIFFSDELHHLENYHHRTDTTKSWIRSIFFDLHDFSFFITHVKSSVDISKYLVMNNTQMTSGTNIRFYEPLNSQ